MGFGLNGGRMAARTAHELAIERLHPSVVTLAAERRRLLLELGYGRGRQSVGEPRSDQTGGTFQSLRQYVAYVLAQRL
jgi:hypothetical protein